MADESDRPTEVETVDFVRVASSENGEIMEFPTEEDNTVIFSAIKTQFPVAVGLKYRSESGAWRAVRDVDGNLAAPKEGWGNQLYIISVPETPIGENTETKKRKADTTDSSKGASESKKSKNDEKLKRDLPVIHLPYKCTSEELKEYFEKNFGAVAKCSVKMDHPTKKSRGFGFVRFKDVDVARKAIDSSHTLHGRVFSVMLKTETPFKLFVGNINKESNASEIREHFDKYGEILEVAIPKNSKNLFCFVTFAQKHDAVKVMKDKKMKELGGRKLRVSEASNQVGGHQGYGNPPPSMGQSGGGFHGSYAAGNANPYGGYAGGSYGGNVGGSYGSNAGGSYGSNAGGSYGGNAVGSYGDNALEEGLKSMLYSYFGGGGY